MRKNIYKWHRALSLIIAIPVVLWAASGFMHPIMTTIRPKAATQFLAADAVDTSKIKQSLQQALQKNGIAQFHNFRLVHIENNWFYQVQINTKELPVYLSTQTGKKLPDGDRLYAQYLGKLFLEGKNKNLATQPIVAATAAHDCCDAATNCVLLNDKGSKVSAMALVRNFDSEYKFVNKVLPVYKVKFDREDGIRIYVETTADKFAYAVDNKRATFDKLFALFHNWSWMDMAGKTKYYFMGALLILTCFTTLMGLYIFFITKTKTPNGNPVVKARRNHRWTSVLISLFTLMFAFSGAYHALDKLGNDSNHKEPLQQLINAQAMAFDLDSLQQKIKNPITNIRVVQMRDQLYWQVFTKSPSGNNGPRKDLMKDKTVPPPDATYINVKDGSTLPDGEKLYAQYLATQYSGHAQNDIVATTAITKFEGEYGFVNKLLPVWKVSYATNSNERYYVETSTGKLSVRINDEDLYEGYSFAMLHKHHFMDWAGKEVRDFSTMFWAAAQIAVVVIGFILWRRVRRRNNIKTV